jgi:hypothetical protein
VSTYVLREQDLEDFVAFCESQGWVRMTPVGWNEALRMRHADRQHPLLVSSRMATWGESQRMLDAWGAVGGAWVPEQKRQQVLL